MFEIAILILLVIATVIAGSYTGLIAKGFDRKIGAYFQSRIGPPIRQPFWDLKKLMIKQTIIPENAVKWVYKGAPLLCLASSVLLLVYVWVPYFLLLSGMDNSFFLRSGDLILIIYLLLIPAIALIIGGFSAGSPLSTIGAQREMVILIATELPIAIAIVTIAWKMKFLAPGYESFAIGTVASHPFWSGMGPLGIMGGMLLVFTFMIIIPAEVAKIPFDQSEAESEIAEGLLSEYSGKHLAFFQLGESVKAIAVVSLAVVLFFPHSFTALTGYRVVPFGVDITLVVDIIFFLFKVFLVYTVSISLIRVSMARFKISQVSQVFIYILSIVSLSGFLLIYLDPSILVM